MQVEIDGKRLNARLISLTDREFESNSRRILVYCMFLHRQCWRGV